MISFFRISIFIKVACYLKIFVKNNQLIKKLVTRSFDVDWGQICHVLRLMDESSNPFIIQAMFMVSAYPSSERFVLDDLIPVFLFSVF